MVDTTVDTAGRHHHDRDGADLDLPAGTEIGEYVVEEVIGRGGMGVVYRATHPVIGGRVAIKVLAMDRVSDPQHVNRFIQEARTANEIRHRNIVDVFTIGRLETGQVYCVMEYLDGVSLADHLRAHGALSVTDALVVLQAIARALDAAHAKGVVHRDIKPGNIFLLRDGETGTLTQAKLLDFGVAKLLATSVISAEHRTETGSWVGTPAYMPPEQWNAKDVDARADVYSFGVMAYQMVTGQLPFKADNFAELLVLQQTELPRPASQIAAHLPPAVDAVLQRAMHKDAAQRFDKTSDVVTALADAAHLAHVLPSGSLPRLTAASSGVAAPAASGAIAAPAASGAIAAPASGGIAVPAASGGIAVPDGRPRRSRWLAFAAAGLAFAITAIAIAAWPRTTPTNAAAAPGAATTGAAIPGAPTTAATTPSAATTGAAIPGAPITAAATPGAPITAAATPGAPITAAATPGAPITAAATPGAPTTAASMPAATATPGAPTTAASIPAATATPGAPTTAAPMPSTVAATPGAPETAASINAAATPTTAATGAPPTATSTPAASTRPSATTKTTSSHAKVAPPTKPARAKPNRPKRAPASKSTGEVVDDMAVPL